MHFFIKIRETIRETCFGGIKYYLFAAEQIRNFYIEGHEMMRKNAGKFFFLKLNKNYKKQSINNHD